MNEDPVADALSLLTWRRTIGELYAEVRAAPDPQAAWRPSSGTSRIATSNEDAIAFTRFGHVGFEAGGVPLSLEVYWLEGYGGGLFVPFAEPTSGDETYGRTLPAGHDQGSRPRARGCPAALGFQLRLSAVLRLRSALDLPACPTGQPALGARVGRRALHTRTAARHCRQADQARRSPQPRDADRARVRGSEGAAAGEGDAIVTGSTPRCAAVDQWIGRVRLADPPRSIRPV
jgi:hypothetical protein